MSFLSLFGQSSYDSMYNDSSTYNSMYGTNDGATAAAAAGLSLVMLLIGFLVAIAAYVVSSIFLSKIFKKAGVEGWKAWVPFYNTWIMLELGDQKGFWAVLLIIPVVNIVAVVFMIIAEYNIGLKLGKEGAFVLLAIFLPIVWLIWLAVDKSTWKGAVPAAAAHPAATSAPTPPVPDTEKKPPVPPQTPPTEQ